MIKPRKFRTFDDIPPITFNEAMVRADGYREERNVEMAAVWEYLAVLTQKVIILQGQVQRLEKGNS